VLLQNVKSSATSLKTDEALGVCNRAGPETSSYRESTPFTLRMMMLEHARRGDQGPETAAAPCASTRSENARAALPPMRDSLIRPHASIAPERQVVE